MKFAHAILLTGLLLISVVADEKPDTSYLPPEVQRRIQEWKGEGDLKKVRTRKTADGVTVYEVDYKERGDEKTILISEDGRVISETEGKKEGHEEKKGQKDKKERRERAAEESKQTPQVITRPQSGTRRPRSETTLPARAIVTLSNPQEISKEEVPPAVVKALHLHAPEAPVEHIHRGTWRDRLVYQFSFVDNGEDHHLQLDQLGNLVFDTRYPNRQ